MVSSFLATDKEKLKIVDQLSFTLNDTEFCRNEKAFVAFISKTRSTPASFPTRNEKIGINNQVHRLFREKRFSWFLEYRGKGGGKKNLRMLLKPVV